MSKEKLAEAMREEKLPKFCKKHPKAVWYDSTTCPACDAEREFCRLTDKTEK